MNTAPVAVADSYTTPLDTALVVSASGVLGNDSDVDSDSASTITLGEHDQADAYDESEDEEPPTKRPNSTCEQETCKLLI